MDEKTIKTVFILGGLPKPRIEKRINTALKESNVSIICWNQTGEEKNIDDDRYEHYIYSIQSDLNLLTRISPFFSFQKRALKKLEELEPDIIHVPGLHMAMIGFKYYKRAKKKPIFVYEVPDLLRMVVEPQKGLLHKIAQIYLRHMEKKVCKILDLLVITSEKFYDIRYQSLLPRSKVFYFPNVPDLSVFSNYQKHKHDVFTVGFIGVIRYKRETLNLIEAAERLGNIRLLIAGNEIDGDEVTQAIQGKDYIEKIGRFDFTQSAASLYEKCDVVYSVYNADLQNVRVALPNKLYEAIYYELPIIVAKKTYLSEIVEEAGVGVAVDHTSLDELVEAIQEIRDEEKYKEIVSNCVKNKDSIDFNKIESHYLDKIKLILK